MKPQRSTRAFVFIALTLMLCWCSLAWGQEELASVTGVVTDQTDAAVPGVQVTLTDTRTNKSYVTTTTDIGAYLFVKLSPGPGYTMTFQRDGFATFTISDVYLGAAATRTYNARLKIGTVTETVEIKGQGVTVNTTDATIGNNFDMNLVHELPIQIRNSPAALLGLQPGVVSNVASADDPNSNIFGSVTGARADQGNITVDGMDANDFATGQAFATTANAPVESVQEFRGETGNPLASAGRGSGAQIQLITKSGTNKFHGSAWEFNRNRAFVANSYFNNRIGLPRPQLVRNQYGWNLGGPIKKDKLFFFFDYEGRRDAQQINALRIVPLDHVRNGELAYINNTAGCTRSSRLTTSPQCITILNAAQVAALDPQGIGANPDLVNFVNSRYPQANDLSVGDGVNTGGFRFNAPVKRLENEYVGRVDYNMTSKMKLFGRFNMVHENVGDSANFSAPIQFPGDPTTHTISDNSWSAVIGHTWIISPNTVNQLMYGETRSELGFPDLYNPLGTTYYQTFANNGNGTSLISSPFLKQDSQARIIPIPELRDDLSLTRGNHNYQFGGTYKTIKTRSGIVNDFNFVTMGLGGTITALNDPRLRPSLANGDPADMLSSATAQNLWDSLFAWDLGRFAEISTNFNYNSNLDVLANGTGAIRHYRYREFEVYGQDTWRVRPNLTLTYGLRWQYYSVPYETDGIEATPNVDFASLITPRLINGPAGVATNTSSPILSYDLAGKANGRAGLYNPDYKDFSPRLAFAYNPSFKEGTLGRLFGDHKTVIRGGGTMVFDHVAANAINFIQDQLSYLFQNSNAINFGTGDPYTSLQTDPRFTGPGTLPTTPAAPAGVRPLQPFVDPSGVPFGAGLGAFNYTVDPHFKTPYAITVSFGLQRELPGNFMLEANYFGRFARRLFAEADAGQVVNFTDPGSGQTLVQAWSNMVTAVRAGSAPAAQPFFENQCFPGCTSVIVGALGNLVQLGDLADTIWLLDANNLLAPNVGLSGQFASNNYITNKSSSNYNALLMTLHKRMSHNLQFDLNYSYSHAIDNLSSITNTVGGGLVCDVTNLRVCRGNSDFDIRHQISATYIYQLPVGRGQMVAGNSPGWLNQIIGNWQVSGITAWHTGLPFTVTSDSFPISFIYNAPGIFNGDSAAVATGIHNDPTTGGVQFFSDPTAAMGAFRGPLGLEAGQRNIFRGPGFFNTDLGLAKNFPIREGMRLQFRADAFNVFNHTSFALPANDFTETTGTTFGQITRTATTARVLQLALRFDF